MDQDGQLAVELNVCRAYQIPHSQFLAWSKLDRDKAIWQYLRAKSTCGGCGTRPEEWDESADGDRNAYRTELRRCRGCELIAIQQKAAGDQPLGDGTFIALRRNTN